MDELTPFEPATGFAGPHAQTLVARVRRSPRGPELRRERLATPDGDFVDLDWGPDPAPDAPIVLILHGLEGSARRRYVRSVARELLRLGVRPVGLNFRGCSGEPNRALRFYHSGETTDPSFVLATIRGREPGRRVGALGFSLGGNVLLKLLGERDDGGVGLVEAAVAMSVPYDLSAGCALLERSAMGQLYAAYFLRSLRRKVRAKEEALRGSIDVLAAVGARTIRAFDDALTAPLAGFADAAESYRLCSSQRFLPTIRTPTLLLHAEDDPFLPRDRIPTEAASANPRITLSLHPRGGHVGFLGGSLARPRFWGDETAAAWLAARLHAVP